MKIEKEMPRRKLITHNRQFYVLSRDGKYMRLAMGTVWTDAVDYRVVVEDDIVGAWGDAVREFWERQGVMPTIITVGEARRNHEKNAKTADT